MRAVRVLGFFFAFALSSVDALAAPEHPVPLQTVKLSELKVATTSTHAMSLAIFRTTPTATPETKPSPLATFLQPLLGWFQKPSRESPVKLAPQIRSGLPTVDLVAAF
jgi:hypothetical protein